MKAQNPLRRVLLGFSLVGCICALALPAAAGARPIIYQPVSHLTATTSTPEPPTAYHPHGRPSAYSALDEPSSGKVVPPASYTLPAGFHTDAQTTGKAPTTSTAPSVVVREVHTVTNGSDHTLAIVLASCALGIALLGTAFAVSRTSRLQRRAAQSNS
jgi:hypothetical protein